MKWKENNILMKKLFIMCVALVMALSTVSAYEKMNLKDVAENKFAAQRIDGINPLKGKLCSILSKQVSKQPYFLM